MCTMPAKKKASDVPKGYVWIRLTAKDQKRGRATSAELEALLEEADALEERGERRRAFRLFLAGALAGSGDCAMRVSCCYAAGEGTRRDLEEALRWSRVARRRNAPSSAYNLAVD